MPRRDLHEWLAPAARRGVGGGVAHRPMRSPDRAGDAMMTIATLASDRYGPDCGQTSPSWNDVYDDLVARLRSSGVGAGAPDVGDSFPDFMLPDASGQNVTLRQMLTAGPLVLSFNRGGWCPFCRSELASWHRHAGELRERGARLVSISPAIGGGVETLRSAAGADATLLCDVDHGVALAAGLVFSSGFWLRERYLECGLDLFRIYGSGSWFLAIPATFAIDRTGIVRFAHVQPDFRLRADPGAVLEALT